MTESVTVGFTASRSNPTEFQRAWVHTVLRGLFVPGAAFRHGDCVGGDAFGAEVAMEVGYHVIAHPPSNPALRAHAPSHEVLRPLPYGERNAMIVQRSTVLVGVPRWPEDHPSSTRSGTWQTIRMARRLGLPTRIWQGINP